MKRQQRFAWLQLLIAVCFMFGQLIPVKAASRSDFTDLRNDVYGNALVQAVNNGLIPQSSGRLRPNDYLTRAEFASMLVYALKATEMRERVYSDVMDTTPYAHALRKVAYIGLIRPYGYSLRPNVPITREEVAIGLATMFRLAGYESYLDGVEDKDAIAPEARIAVGAMLRRGYFKLSNGKVNPKGFMTRGEFAYILKLAISQFINQPGTYTQISQGNVIINVPGVTLKDVTVTGDLIIADGVGEGDVTLDHVDVKGRLLVTGGGRNSVHVQNGSLIEGRLMIDDVQQRVRVVISDDSRADEVWMISGGIFEGDTNLLILGLPENSGTSSSEAEPDRALESGIAVSPLYLPASEPQSSELNSEEKYNELRSNKEPHLKII